MLDETAIDVCICTYRRASLADTLRSIAAQRLPPRTRLRVIVADNDDTPSARGIVQQARKVLGLECHYIVAPAQNISIARNACLDAVEAPLFAFIDDDEVATEAWIAELLAGWRKTGATVVFGPVAADYGDGPEWLRRADLHSIRPVILSSGTIETGYTCNVLIDRAALGETLSLARFDPKLGRSGGEDTVFFSQLFRGGARMAYWPAAVVNEVVGPHRGRLAWLLKRYFRSGQSFARVQREQRRPALALAALAAAKAGFCMGGAMFRAGSAPGWRRWLVRGALHAGVAAQCMGVRDLRLY
jgi:succinoglycan biosynthesis protein ExoM